MTGKTVKVSDFARDAGVTSRAIQRHIQNLGQSLEGHIERRGPHNAIWMDEIAQELVRSRMDTTPPPVVSDSSLLDENAALRDTLLKLQNQHIELQQRMIELTALAAEAATSRKMLAAAEKKENDLQMELNTTREEAAAAANMASLEAAAASARIEELQKQVEEANCKAAAMADALEEEKGRKLSWRERLTGRKV